MTVAEAINTTTAISANFTVTRVGAPLYTTAPVGEISVAVSGRVLLNGLPVATVTALSMNIDNQMAAATVVGRNVKPISLWGYLADITGSMTVLFDRQGAGETAYNAFDLEQDARVYVRLDNSARTQFMSFSLPRVKFSTGGIGDAVAEGLPVTLDFVALKPSAFGQGTSAILIQDSTVTGI
jgi:hypothetical protein